MSNQIKRGWEHPFFNPVEKKPEVVSHRGGAREFPEETVYACLESLRIGVDVLEVDVRSASGGELVLMHNKDVDATTDGTGFVNEKTLQDLQLLDAGHRWTEDRETFKYRRDLPNNIDHRVPTLSDVFKALPQKPRMVIEIKQKNPCVIEPLVKLIRQFEMTEKVLIASFYHSVLKKFRKACPEVATSASTVELFKFIGLNTLFPGAGNAPEYDAVQVGIRFKNILIPFINERTVRAARKYNLPIQAWTVNREDDMKRMIELNVDGIITDYPCRLLKLLKRNPPC